MNRLPVLLRREIAEHRGVFLYLPLVISAFIIGMMLMSFALSGSFSYTMSRHDGEGLENRHVEVVAPLSRAGLEQFAQLPMEKREVWLRRAVYGTGTPLFLALWLVVFSYLLMTLYNERKDRSILFWKSMPVSDAMTVVSKLLVAVVFLPAAYALCVIALQAFALGIAMIAAASYGIGAWDVLWKPAHLFSEWGNLLGYIALNSIWCLPAVAWLLLVSSWARSVPLVWALSIPLGLIIVERIVLPFRWISNWISQYSWPLGLPQSIEFNARACLSLVASPEMAVSLAIAGAMLFGAIYMRGRTDEI